MTSPDLVLPAARLRLLNDAGFSALLGTDVGKDSASGDGAYKSGWVFRQTDDNMDPLVNPRSTGTSAVVLGMRRSWTNPNTHNTLRFPLLSVRIVSDSTRTDDVALPQYKDAEDRCRRVGKAIFDVFHNPQNDDHWWPNSVFIVSHVLWSDLTIHDIDGEDGLVEGLMSFALMVG